jgi:hypothetical protein
MESAVIGRRVSADDVRQRFETLKPGDYYLLDGHWGGITPNDHHCNLAAHIVVEHADGTITVTPSIRVFNNVCELWHGFLTNGVWKEC